MGAAELALPIVTMSEAQAYVRIETGEEEALLAGLIRTASALCEAFLCQAVIARPFSTGRRGTGHHARSVFGFRGLEEPQCGNSRGGAESLGPDGASKERAWRRGDIARGSSSASRRGAAALDVVLIDQEQWLTSCDDEALAVGCNLAVLGSEVLQFGDVEPLGPGRFRLTRLRRGCAGTEWAMEGHAVGEPFALIEREALTAVPVPLWMKKTNVIAVVRNPSGTSSVSAPLSIGTRETDQAALPG